MSDLSRLGDFADVLQCEVGVGIACVQNAFFLHPFSSQLPITWVSFGGVQLGRHMVQKATIGIVLRSVKGRVSLLTSIGSSVLWSLVLVLVSSEASGDVFKMMAMKLFSRL